MTQTEKYLAGDSTSVPVETAQELLRSLVYTLRLALPAEGLPERALLTVELTGLLRRGQTVLQEKTEQARALWAKACLTAPPIENLCYRDTLTGLGRFFGRYDLWYFAHRVPCAIDYPLCIPVSEELQGVSYVGEWLRCLLLENWFLGRFPAENVTALLERSCRDYRELPLNLCEQPLINALGLAALGRPVFPLSFSAEERARLAETLRGSDDLGAALKAAARAVSAQLAPCPPGAAAYLEAVGLLLRPRLETALRTDGLCGVFL